MKLFKKTTDVIKGLFKKKSKQPVKPVKRTPIGFDEHKEVKSTPVVNARNSEPMGAPKYRRNKK